MRSSKQLLNSHSKMQSILEANKELRVQALKSEKAARMKTKLLNSVGHISLLMSFKLADMVNIALEEGSYFRSREWSEKHKGKLLVESQQEDWQR